MVTCSPEINISTVFSSEINSLLLLSEINIFVLACSHESNISLFLKKKILAVGPDTTTHKSFLHASYLQNIAKFSGKTQDIV